MRLHCDQASQRPSMTTDRPPLLVARIDPGIWPNISMCVRGVGAYVCIAKIFLTMQVINRKTHTNTTT